MTEEQPRDNNGRFASKGSSDGETPQIDTASGFDINFKEIPDENTQKAVQKLLEEREALKSQVSSISERLTKMDEREQQKQFEKARNTKMTELRQLDHRLADKHKDESDLDKIDLLIDTARSFNSNFAEYSKEKEDVDAPKQIMGYIDPKTGEIV